ncbi:MAG TPA: FAD-binding oxidoreductase [Mycobacteriales bacterium]|jgi:alkyldihydroxyacetonephosphate synthase|nr:FAD-binding oxidoreductase [Mycobacteriales bacterium]
MTHTWTTWADDQPTLSRSTLGLLEQLVGPLTPSVSAPVEQARLQPSALPEAARSRLAATLGDDGVLVDDRSRAEHSGGQSYVDIVRRRHGDASAAPDAILLPSDAAAVARVLEICTDEHVAVVPWGGGTSVVGGLDALRGDCVAVVALDLQKLDRLLAVDAESHTATFQPGIRTPDAEAALAEHGFTLGHVPQSYERASLGGYVVTRSAGQASSGYGRIDDLVVGLQLATPVGELVLPAMPGSAAGPDLRRLVLGSEGTLGVVTEVTLRVRPRPAVRRYEGWMLPSWDAGAKALRALAQRRDHPDITRLSDQVETQISLSLSGSGGVSKRLLAAYLHRRHVADGCLVIVGFEGDADDVKHRRRVTAKVLRSAGGVALGRRAGRAWEHGRFSGPRMRDSMLDAGVLAETLETATTWTGLSATYDAVRSALQTSLGRAVVGCHVSHLYETGASLYFTVLAAADSGREVEQWTAAKEAANDAIVSTGATITHHHAVGTAHRQHVAAEIGAVGVAALRAVKERLDPAGILNPGKLLPTDG